MHAEDRLIHFSVELIHAPAKREKAQIQELYFELSKIPGAGYDNTEFSVPNQPRFYTRRGSKTQSVMVILPDRLLIVEEWADCTLNAFVDRVANATECAKRVLNIQAILAQTAVMRAACALSHFSDARVFLIDHVCKQEGRIGPFFQRPIAVAGLRFVLPATPDHPGTYHIAIEPFRHALSELFVEAKAVYKSDDADGISSEDAANRLHEVRGFIRDNVYPYLDQFDMASEAT